MKPQSLLLTLATSLTLTLSTNLYATVKSSSARVEDYSIKSSQRISDEKAVELAIKAIEKEKIFGGVMLEYSNTIVKQYGQNLRVTFIRELQPEARGSETMYSVELNAMTGKFVRFLGY